MKVGLCCMALVMILGMGGCGKERIRTELNRAQETLILFGFFGDIQDVAFHDHVWEDLVLTEGNCMDPKVVSHVCRECGAKKSNTVDYGERARFSHDYQPYSGSCVELEYNLVIFYRCDQCSRCGEEKNRQQTGFEPLASKEVP